MIKTQDKELNLSAYFMLPLLKLNINSFGGKNNLDNVYITIQMQVVVVIYNPEECSYDYTQDVNYILDYDEDDKTTIVYQLDEVWEDDFLYYTKGMYSKLTHFAKDEIKKNSTLVNKKVRVDKAYDANGKYIGNKDIYEIHPALRALDKCPILKAHLEKELDVKIKDDMELLDKIKVETEFIKL